MSWRRGSVGAVCAAILVAAPFALAGCGGGGSDGEGEDGGEIVFSIPGDAARGKALYAKHGCGRCHTFAAADSTGTTGPNLDEAVNKYKDGDFIRESIIAPSAFVEMGSGGSIGGNKEYPDVMPSYGPRVESDKVISEQDVNDLTVFLVEQAEQ